MIPMGTMARLFDEFQQLAPELAEGPSQTPVFLRYSRVSARSHRDLVTGVEDGGETGQNLGHGSGEHHMPCREEQRYRIRG